MRLEPSLPPDALATIRAPFLEAGAELLDAPTVQPLGQLLDLAGEALRERLFILQSEGVEETCLRPDFTLPAVRAHIASGRTAGRYYYEGHAFRVARAGLPRAEEFLQIGIETFASEAIGIGDIAAADAEIAALAWRSAAAGGRKDLKLIFGDVSLFSAFLESHQIPLPLRGRLERAFANPRRLRAELAAADDPEPPKPGDRLAILLGDVSESEAAAALEEIWRLSGIAPVGGRSAVEIVHRLRERAAIATAPHLTAIDAEPIRRFLAVSEQPQAALRTIGDLAGRHDRRLRDGLEAWGRRLQMLEAQGTPMSAITLSAAFGRDFGYYDGVLFEVRSTALGDDAPVAAGGRYDGLPARLGASLPVAAVGCMVRPGRAWCGAAP